jgi:hypothetical protein
VDNRTIRRALMRRVPEVYFIHAPVRANRKIYWRILANIKIKGGRERIFKILADMPETALISHKELLNTMISEVYTEVQNIKNRVISPKMLSAEQDWTPISDEDERALGINTIEEMIGDSPKQILELDALNKPVNLPTKKSPPKLVGFDEK